MFKKLFHSALWGLAAAGVILFAVPKLNNSSLFSADDIVSFNSAVRIASPAVVIADCKAVHFVLHFAKESKQCPA